MDPDPAQAPRTEVSTHVEQINQVLVFVLAAALGLGLTWVVVVFVSTASAPYRALAALTVIMTVGGVLAGYTATTYSSVVSVVRWLANVGAMLMGYVGFFSPETLAPPVSVGLGVIVSAMSFVPRVAVLGTAGVMLAASLFVFELARVGGIEAVSVVASSLWIIGSGTLVGNGLAEVRGRGAA